MSVAVPQRLVIVLPTTGVYDSRTHRIATSAMGRGHEVTVVARAAPGLPAEETGPAGYRVLRVEASAIDGLPRGLRHLVRGVRGRRPARPSGEPGPGKVAAGPPAARIRRALAAAVRLAAIALTARAQSAAVRRLDLQPDLVHGMAYLGIPVALDLGHRHGVPVVYDARDIYVDAHNLARMPAPARRFFGRLERGWARAAHRVITVNEPYAAVMAERWGLPSPLVVMNCSHALETGVVRPGLFHERLGLPADIRIVLYQGGFSRGRGIEELIGAIPAVSDAALVLLGYGALEAELRARADEPALTGRLFVLPAVPPAELLQWVAAADVVAMPIQPSTLNHRLTTPNKLFEAMAAGVPVVASDLPGMAPIVRETGCGVLCDPTSPEAIAGAIRSILDAPPPARERYRERARSAVASTYNWALQAGRLFAEYERLTGRPW